MYMMADGLARLLAPILPVTAEQLWHALPPGPPSTEGHAGAAGSRDASVHLAVFPAAADLQAMTDADLLRRWERLIDVRERVLAEIEPLRKSKQIGSSLQAKVVLHTPREQLALLERYRRDLPMLFIVSEVELRPAPEEELMITIERASGVKCERCWRYVDKVSADPAWAGLCDRCQDALAPGDQAA
jgi:isoleucyl-tRNA synthetase